MEYKCTYMYIVMKHVDMTCVVVVAIVQVTIQSVHVTTFFFFFQVFGVIEFVNIFGRLAVFYSVTIRKFVKMVMTNTVSFM